MSIGPNLLRGAFSQIAYVTSDFDRALDELRRMMGVEHFLELRDIEFAVRRDAAAARCHIGLAMSGGLQIELIQPLGGEDGVYRDALRAGDSSVRFHHVAQALPSLAQLDELRDEVRAAGLPIPIDAEAPQGMTYFYADARALLGHYVEYTWSTPEFAQSMAQAIPAN